MELSTALDFARTTTKSVLTTVRADGRPQLSNVLQRGVGDDGVIRVSITTNRAKYVNLDARRGRHCASPAITGPTPCSRATSPCPTWRPATMRRSRWPPAAARGRRASNSDDFRAAMVRDGRVLVRLRPTAPRHAGCDRGPRGGSDRAGRAGHQQPHLLRHHHAPHVDHQLARSSAGIASSCPTTQFNRRFDEQHQEELPRLGRDRPRRARLGEPEPHHPLVARERHVDDGTDAELHPIARPDLGRSVPGSIQRSRTSSIVAMSSTSRRGHGGPRAAVASSADRGTARRAARRG